jgi:predicted DNA-binding transcriptional regulator AlpA
MSEYDFTLKFSLPDPQISAEQYVDALIGAGCDDALIGIGQQGRIALNFTREANSAREAVGSAINEIRQVIPAAKLIEATPDLVGLTDVAELLGFSRQNMRKIMLNGGAAFPPPLHDGKPAIWHLAKILEWVAENGNYRVDETLSELARVTMGLNIVREIKEVDSGEKRELLSLIA